MKDRELTYESDLLEAVGVNTVIDDVNGIIRGVTILQGDKVSLNKTFYERPALEQALTRYEGAKMFLDHPAKGETNRSINDFGGVYRDLKIDGNRLRGDLHLVESKRAMVIGIAKMKAPGVAISIRDRGYGFEKEGVFHVQGFTEGAQFAGELVTEASVNKTLFESHETEIQEEQMDWKIITPEALRKERPDLVESITNEATKELVKELNEAKADSKKAGAVLEKANKTLALAEAAFDADVLEAIRKMIEPESVNLETAKAIITGQKNLLEALAKKSGNGAPHVKGVGHRKVEEGAAGEGADLTSEDHIADAFKS